VTVHSNLGGDLFTVIVIGLHSNVSQSRIYRLAGNDHLIQRAGLSPMWRVGTGPPL
jgi:hypothetical protein